MDEAYDAIVLGTGLKECILSGMLSVAGLKVLHLDRQSYYGGDSASLNLTQLWELFMGKSETPKELGHNRDWNVDLIPKFIMADGKLVKMLVHTDVTRYLEFKAVAGSYVYRQGNVHKVPSTEREAVTSPLMGLMERTRVYRFLSWLNKYNEAEKGTYKGNDPTKQTMKQIYAGYSLAPDTVEFLGHAVALYTNEEYQERLGREAVTKMQLYNRSLQRYGGSPYIYPQYGLGELPQSFARLSAVWGGTYMLNKPVDRVVYNDAGQAIGVESEGFTATAKFVVGDPSYFPDKVKKTGQVARCICILTHPVPNTNDADSCQIIVPGRQVNRKNDIYVCAVSASHKVCGANRYIAIVATTVETNNPAAELEPGLKLLGAVEHKFMSRQDTFEPVADGKEDKCFISKSFDATTHFETTSDDVLSLFERIMGRAVDLDSKPVRPDEPGYVGPAPGSAAAAPRPEPFAGNPATTQES